MTIAASPAVALSLGRAAPSVHDHVFRNQSVGRDVQLSRLWPAVVSSDRNQDVLGRLFGIFDENVIVSVVVEDTCVEQLILKLVLRAPTVRLYQISTG
jgi:hypothetical protein